MPNHIPGQQPQSLHIKHNTRLAWVGFWGLRIFLEALGMGFPCLFPPGCGAGPVQGQRFGCYRQIPVPNSGQTRRKFTSHTEKSTSQFGLKGLFLGTGGTQRCPPRDFFVSHHRGAPPMPNPSPPCKTGRAGVWPTGACSGHNWGLRMRPQSPPGVLNTEMWLGAQLFFSSRFTRGARYGKWARCMCVPGL